VSLFNAIFNEEKIFNNNLDPKGSAVNVFDKGSKRLTKTSL
jgi:hypothetical protein